MLYLSLLTESWVEGKSVEEKDAQPTERTAALWGLSSKSIQDFEWTSQGMDWGWGQGIKSTTTDVSRNLATVVVRGVLPVLRKRRTGLLPSGPKSSFQMRASFVFHLETNVLESGEAHSPSCLKSSVKFPHSVMIWGECHLLVLVHCVFGKPTSLHASFCWPAF